MEKQKNLMKPKKAKSDKDVIDQVKPKRKPPAKKNIAGMVENTIIENQKDFILNKVTNEEVTMNNEVNVEVKDTIIEEVEVIDTDADTTIDTDIEEVKETKEIETKEETKMTKTVETKSRYKTSDVLYAEAMGDWERIANHKVNKGIAAVSSIVGGIVGSAGAALLTNSNDNFKYGIAMASIGVGMVLTEAVIDKVDNKKEIKNINAAAIGFGTGFGTSLVIGSAFNGTMAFVNSIEDTETKEEQNDELEEVLDLFF